MLIATGKGLTSPLTVGFSIKSAFAAARRLHLAVGQLGDLEFRRHRLADAHKLAGLVERFDKVRERTKMPSQTDGAGQANGGAWIAAQWQAA